MKRKVGFKPLCSEILCVHTNNTAHRTNDFLFALKFTEWGVMAQNRNPSLQRVAGED